MEKLGSSVLRVFVVVALLIQQATTIPTESGKTCPGQSARWNDYGGEICYIVEKYKEVDWNEARHQCSTAGGLLASFHSSEEVRRILPHLSSHMYYIGLRRNSAGTFVWEDKSALDFVNWEEGQPNDANEMCAVMSKAGEWHDYRCKNLFRYICSAAKTTTIATQSGKKCPSQSKKWNDYGGEICYIVENNEDVDWNEALYKCFRAGGSLASFHSTEEVQRILPLISRKFYHIGLRQNGDGTFEWADKSALDFKNWKLGQPDSKFKMCGFMENNGEWDDYVCNDRDKYICSAAKALPAPELPKVCPPRSNKWRDLGGKFCYIVEVTSAYTYSDALNRCIKEGGSLASFHSALEVSLILHEIHGTDGDLFIGLQRSSTYPDIIEWSDQSAVDFLNWGFSDLVNESCTTMYTARFYLAGKWHNVRCDNKFGYVCSAPKEILCSENLCKNGGTCTEDGEYGVPRCYCVHGYYGRSCEKKILCSEDTCKNDGSCTQDGVDGVFRCSCSHGYEGLTCQETTTIAPESEKKCPSQSEKWNDYGREICYIVEEDERVDWNEAFYKCFRAGGSLATFHSVEELRGILPHLSAFGYYIGLRQTGDGTFERADKSALDFANWAPGEPNNKNEMCVYMYSHGEWKDISCNDKANYICSATKKFICSEDICKNGGSCTQEETQGVFRCLCKHGYAGLTCGERILCSEGTCKNGGSCSQDGTDDVFRCLCKHGYRGLTCDEKILCSEDTCQNGGSCTQDGVDGIFRCTCTNSYEGLICEKSGPNFKMQRIGEETYIIWGSAVVHVETNGEFPNNSGDGMTDVGP